MALIIANSSFSHNGIALGISDIYIDLMFTAPHGDHDLEVKLQPYALVNGAKTTRLDKVDGIASFEFPATEIIQTDFWIDINAGNVHDRTIQHLEQNNPDWLQKITKTIPI